MPLYEGESIRADQFRYGLLVFDLVTIAFIVVTSRSSREAWWWRCSTWVSVSSFLPISWLG
jgi:voltage-gated potassium channel